MNKPNQETLDELKAIYVQKIKAEFPKQLKNFSDKNAKEHQLSQLRGYLHKLVGSGESFGYTDITHTARAAESIATSLMSESTKDKPSRLTYLVKLLEKLAGIVDKIEIESPVTLHSGANFTDRQSNAKLLTVGQAHIAKTERKHTICVWVIDDDESVAAQLSEQLLSFGFDVAYFLSCAAFKQALLSSQPHFVIADVRLEDNSDFYRCADLHRIDLKSFGLIIMSAFDDFHARIKAVRSGAITYLQKPINVARVASFIHEHKNKIQLHPERILIIDDDTDLSALYKSQLEAAGMAVHNLSDPRKVMAAIQEYQPDLVLIDLYMPDFSGMELAAVIRQFDNFTSLPIVYISSETDNQRQSKAIATGGADEFITKPVSADILITALRTRVKRARQLNALISKDSLTGLLKHSAIKEAVKSEIARTSRDRQSLCISMLDIDRFKRVNDTYGHAVGDTVIESLANLLTQRVRQTDHVGRYGGEEFMLVMPGCDAESAQVILDDIRERFSNIEFTVGNKGFHCTVSAGFVQLEASVFLPTADSLVEHADSALYEAKNTGRNRVVQSITARI
ncbi:diguanylate cyclase (GGDEF) domain-containing protein [Idiomarina sp. A28L]|uniref:GGDEF domain-containing response regulator n=1 Tax=Idiomarina sp. A28L TaxID=1036674 RepID=UPI0002138A76|nr:response regulator [Idiomarina sp. A28L]EGN75885.1 diguanylate cyclase (GGDEF) domain-containing protein [Idiomarina sp. A28L]